MAKLSPLLYTAERFFGKLEILKLPAQRNKWKTFRKWMRRFCLVFSQSLLKWFMNLHLTENLKIALHEHPSTGDCFTLDRDNGSLVGGEIHMVAQRPNFISLAGRKPDGRPVRRLACSCVIGDLPKTSRRLVRDQVTCLTHSFVWPDFYISGWHAETGIVATYNSLIVVGLDAAARVLLVNKKRVQSTWIKQYIII